MRRLVAALMSGRRARSPILLLEGPDPIEVARAVEAEAATRYLDAVAAVTRTGGELRAAIDAKEAARTEAHEAHMAMLQAGVALRQLEQTHPQPGPVRWTWPDSAS